MKCKLQLLLSLLSTLILAIGCNYANYSVETKRNKAQFAFFIEGFPRQGEETKLLKFHQAKPKFIHIDPNPVLKGDSGMLTSSKVIDTEDGLHAIQLDFTTLGQSVMEHITTNYRARRLYVVVAQSDVQSKTNKIIMRCIGAKYIQQTVSAPYMVFTPDASREESENIVNLANKTLKDH